MVSLNQRIDAFNHQTPLINPVWLLSLGCLHVTSSNHIMYVLCTLLEFGQCTNVIASDIIGSHPHNRSLPRCSVITYNIALALKEGNKLQHGTQEICL